VIVFRNILLFRKPGWGASKRGTSEQTADTALRLSRHFGTTAKFWLFIQTDFYLEEEINSKNNP